MSTPAEARAAGVVFYDLPSELAPDQCDELIRPIVHRINQSGVCWTAESCQGHPDAAATAPWAGNTDPMLRLVCERKHLGRVMTALIDASERVPEEESAEDPYGFASAHPIRMFPHTNPQAREAGWAEILVYLSGSYVWARNRGLRVFARFAELLHTPAV